MIVTQSLADSLLLIIGKCTPAIVANGQSLRTQVAILPGTSTTGQRSQNLGITSFAFLVKLWVFAFDAIIAHQGIPDHDFLKTYFAIAPRATENAWNVSHAIRRPYFHFPGELDTDSLYRQLNGLACVPQLLQCDRQVTAICEGRVHRHRIDDLHNRTPIMADVVLNPGLTPPR
jgi:hypothetical protein